MDYHIKNRVEFFYLDGSCFYQVKNGKSEKEREKLILKTKACNSCSSTPLQLAPKNYPHKCIKSKTPKIKLHGFTKPRPFVTRLIKGMGEVIATPL